MKTKKDPASQMKHFKMFCPFGQETAKQCTPTRYNDCKQCEQSPTPIQPVRRESMKQKALYYVAQMAQMAARDVRNDERFMFECAKIADELLKRGDKCRETLSAKNAD